METEGSAPEPRGASGENPLTRKLGPLPLWAWAGLGVGAVIFVPKVLGAIGSGSGSGSQATTIPSVQYAPPATQSSGASDASVAQAEQSAQDQINAVQRQQTVDAQNAASLVQTTTTAINQQQQVDAQIAAAQAQQQQDLIGMLFGQVNNLFGNLIGQNQTFQQANLQLENQLSSQQSQFFGNAESAFNQETAALNSLAPSFASAFSTLLAAARGTGGAPISGPAPLIIPSGGGGGGGQSATWNNPTPSGSYNGANAAQVHADFLAAAGGDPARAQQMWETQHAAEVARNGG